MSQKRDWSKDRQLHKLSTILHKESLNELTEGAGKPLWSKATQSFQTPKRGKRIDPNSPEGQAIIKRLTQI